MDSTREQGQFSTYSPYGALLRPFPERQFSERKRSRVPAAHRLGTTAYPKTLEAWSFAGVVQTNQGRLGGGGMR